MTLYKEDKIVSIAVPFQQHSFRAAVGLISNGILNTYYTSVYNDGKGIYRILKFVLPKNLLIRMEGRNNKTITPFVKKFSELYGLIYLAVCRIKIGRKFTPWIRSELFKRFSKKTANSIIADGTKVVIAYDTQAYDLFKELKKHNCNTIKILDMASTSAIRIRQIIAEELKKGHVFNETLKRHMLAYSEEKCNAYRREIYEADYFLVPSEFVKESLVDLNVKEDRIIYLSHGVDIEMFKPCHKSYNLKRKLRFLFVGRVEAAKGIYYILESFRQLENYNIELIVVGDLMDQREKFEKYTKNAVFWGLRRRDEMPEIYNDADVFILSSLWEGSSLSMLEALASGLPVIASKYSSAPEVIKDYKEGFVIDPKNIAQMKEKIVWFVNNYELISKMSKEARETAEKYTWEKYGEQISKITKTICQREKLISK